MASRDADAARRKVEAFFDRARRTGAAKELLADPSVLHAPMNYERVARLLDEAKARYDGMLAEWHDLSKHACCICTCGVEDPVSLPPCSGCNVRHLRIAHSDIVPLRAPAAYTTRLVCCRSCVDSFMRFDLPPHKRPASVPHLICRSASYDPRRYSSADEFYQREPGMRT